jgi:hypothetical protein
MPNRSITGFGRRAERLHLFDAEAGTRIEAALAASARADAA